MIKYVLFDGTDDEDRSYDPELIDEEGLGWIQDTACVGYNASLETRGSVCISFSLSLFLCFVGTWNFELISRAGRSLPPRRLLMTVLVVQLARAGIAMERSPPCLLTFSLE